MHSWKALFTEILDEGASLGERLNHLQQLRRNQWKKKKELEKIQLKRLKAIVRHAYAHIPYYHRLLDSIKFKPGDLKDLEDLRKIPITTKLDVKENYPNMFIKGTDYSKYKSSWTSGSTGIPIKFFYDLKTVHYFNTLKLYNFLECGVKLTDKLCQSVSGSWGSNPHVIRCARASVGPFFLRLNTVNVYPILSIDEKINILERIKPDVIHCHPSTLEDICIKVKPEIKPRLIFSHGEVLTQRCRKLVRSTFGTEVYDTYGSTEFRILGSECAEHSGIHVITDSVVVECVRDGEVVASGEPGEVVVTGLSNYLMPLIRYDLGDIVVPTDENCPCGRSWPLIKVIHGRKNDSLTLPSGRLLSVREIWRWFFPEVVEHIWCFSHFKIVQEAQDTIILKIVKGKQYNEKLVDRIVRKAEKDLEGEDVTFSIEIVDEIPKDKSGKRQLIESYA